MNPSFAYPLVLCSSLCFSAASLVFADISRRISPLWMNAFKALVAWVTFAAAAVLLQTWTSLGSYFVLSLLLSGALGLAIGDIFLLTAYARIGAGRTLILYGFQPLFIGVAAHFLFHQELTWTKAAAVLFFLLCLFIFSLERFREHGHWEILGLVMAFMGVLFDNTGVLLTRWVFEQNHDLSALQANLIRCTGALAVFPLLGRWRAVRLREGWQSLDTDLKKRAVIASVMGTFISLILYLTAVKIGHLASVSALAGVNPIWAATLECIYRRSWPSRYLIASLAAFLTGFSVLLLG